MTKSIVISSEEGIVAECVSIIIVPELAVTEAGYIKMLTVKDSAHAKHEYHAMAQMAYYQFQDEELKIQEIQSTITIVYDVENIELNSGMVIYRDPIGEFHVLVHAVQNRKIILETAYRYCTRWVRLDI